MQLNSVTIMDFVAYGGAALGILLATRAFLHDAPFILLDEPTSNLDSLNEAVILRSLKEEARDKTVILVSHRKSTVRIADEVIGMQEGRKIELGTVPGSGKSNWGRSLVRRTGLIKSLK